MIRESAHLSQKVSYVNYKKMRRENPPLPTNGLPKGVWVPVSVAAYLLKCSGQLIRLLYLSKQLNAIKLPGCPILVNMEKYMVDQSAAEAEEEAPPR